MMRLLRLATLSGLLICSTLQGDIGGVPSLTPQQRAIRDAASIKDPEERQRELEKAISVGLLAPDHDTRYHVFLYLERNGRWIDIRPFAATLLRFSQLDNLGRGGLWMLDEAELMRAPRGRREDTYRMAITDGETTLPHGRPLGRKSAILLACDDGLDSLAPFIRDYVKAEYPEGYAALLTTLALGAGAEDRDDAIRLSAKRLRSMETGVLYERLAGDESFRKVVTRVATDGCASNPFLGGVNAGCADMKAAVGGLSAHESVLKRKALAVPPSDTSQRYSALDRTWLDQLKDTVR